MRPDAHKAKASLKWKLKHHIPIKRTDDPVKTAPTARPFQRRTLESNSYRYEQKEETLEDSYEQDTRLLESMKRMDLYQDTASSFQFKDEKEALSSSSESELRSLALDLKSLEACLLRLPLEILLNVPKSMISEEYLEWDEESDFPNTEKLKYKGFCHLLESPKHASVSLLDRVPTKPVHDASLSQVKSINQTKGESVQDTELPAMTDSTTKSTSKKDSENLEEWLDDLLG